MLCSEEITWSAAFAAAPYLAEVARRAQPAARVQYVCFLGAVVLYRVLPDEEESIAQCPPDLEEEFREAVAAALGMAVTLLPTAAGEEVSGQPIRTAILCIGFLASTSSSAALPPSE
jgi:putative Mn2+ efflux pump MntP